MSATPRSNAETLLAVQLEQAGIPFGREVECLSPRKFRVDFMLFHREMDTLTHTATLTNANILVEVEGGTWTEGRHSRGKGFEADCEKQALAVIAGYRYLRVTSAQVEDGRALSWIRQALGVEAAA